jgi:tetratricopeptide (TPR) repeat protein
MVRNEADIIELWARYNLKVLDCLYVINHLSQDNTVEILENLQAEGLPIHIFHVTEPEYAQAEYMRNLVRPLAAQKVADFFIPIDADELICTDKQGLHTALRAIPSGHVGCMRWRTYLPAGGDEPTFFRRMRSYRAAESPMGKVIAPAHLMATHAWVMGNHALGPDGSDSFCPEYILPFPLAHFPIRSEEQLRKKITTAALSLRLKKYRVQGQGWHILSFDDEFRRGEIRNRGIDLQKIGLRYAYSSQMLQDSAVLDDPVADYPDIVRRYDIREVSLADVMAQNQDLIRENQQHLDHIGRVEFNAANQAFRENRIDAALQLYTESSYLNPALTVAYHGRARCLALIGQNVLAEEVLLCALHAAPDYLNGWIALGQLRLGLHKHPAAAEAFAKALALQPDHPKALQGLAECADNPS